MCALIATDRESTNSLCYATIIFTFADWDIQCGGDEAKTKYGD